MKVDWIPVERELPCLGFFWTSWSDGRVSPETSGTIHECRREITHWARMELPDPPVKSETIADIAARGIKAMKESDDPVTYGCGTTSVSVANPLRFETLSNAVKLVLSAEVSSAKCPDCCMGLTGFLPCERHKP